MASQPGNLAAVQQAPAAPAQDDTSSQDTPLMSNSSPAPQAQAAPQQQQPQQGAVVQAQSPAEPNQPTVQEQQAAQQPTAQQPVVQTVAVPVAQPVQQSTRAAAPPSSALQAASSVLPTSPAAHTMAPSMTLQPVPTFAPMDESSGAPPTSSGPTFHITWLIPLFVVLGVLLIATLLGKCWGVLANHSDREAQRKRRRAEGLARGTTITNRNMSQISYETDGYDFFMGKGDYPKVQRQTQSYGQGYGYGGYGRQYGARPSGTAWARDVPTTRTRAGRFEPGIQSNGWWKLRWQQAFGSQQPSYTAFDSMRMGPMGAHHDQTAAFDQSPVSGPTSRAQMSLIEKAAESAGNLARAVKHGPGAMRAWLGGVQTEESGADESDHLLSVAGSPVKRASEELPAFHSPRTSPSKARRNSLFDDDGFFESPLASPAKAGTALLAFEPPRESSPPLSPAASSVSKYTSASWARSAVTAEDLAHDSGDETSRADVLLRKNTLANSDMSATRRSALSGLAREGTSKSRVRIDSRVEEITHGWESPASSDMASPCSVHGRQETPMRRSKTTSARATRLGGQEEGQAHSVGVPSKPLSRASTYRIKPRDSPAAVCQPPDVFATSGTGLQRTDTQGSTSSRTSHSSVSSAATMVEAALSEKAGAFFVTAADVRKIERYAREMATDIISISQRDGQATDHDAPSQPQTPTRQQTRLRIGGRWTGHESTDDAQAPPTSTRSSAPAAQPSPSSPPAVPHVLSVASPASPHGATWQTLLSSPAPRSRAADLFLASPVAAYGESTPPRRAGAHTPIVHSKSVGDAAPPPRHQGTIMHKTYSTISGSTLVDDNDDAPDCSALSDRTLSFVKSGEGIKRSATKLPKTKKLKSPARRTRERDAAMSQVQAIVARKIEERSDSWLADTLAS